MLILFSSPLAAGFLDAIILNRFVSDGRQQGGGNGWGFARYYLICSSPEPDALLATRAGAPAEKSLKNLSQSPISSKRLLPDWQWLHLLGCSRFQTQPTASACACAIRLSVELMMTDPSPFS